MNESASGDIPVPPFGGQPRPELGRVIVPEDELQGRVAALGKEITADYADRPPLLVGVLKGAFLFMSDLARRIDLPVELDFMAVSSYGSATKTSGVVRIIKDLDTDLTDRHVLIVEDIVDSGLTLAYLRKNLAARNPASVTGLIRQQPAGFPSTSIIGTRCTPAARARATAIGSAYGPVPVAFTGGPDDPSRRSGPFPSRSH